MDECQAARVELLRRLRIHFPNATILHEKRGNFSIFLIVSVGQSSINISIGSSLRVKALKSRTFTYKRHKVTGQFNWDRVVYRLLVFIRQDRTHREQIRSREMNLKHLNSRAPEGVSVYSQGECYRVSADNLTEAEVEEIFHMIRSKCKSRSDVNGLLWEHLTTASKVHF